MFTDGAIELVEFRELATAGLKELLRKSDNRAVNSFRLADLESELLHFTDQIHVRDDLPLLKLPTRE